MPTITYPSDFSPAPPRIRIQVPDDWEQVEVPQTLLAARETGWREPGFASNVTIRHLVRSAETSDGSLIAELRDFISGKEQGAISEGFRRLINGVEVHGANLSFVDP